MNKIVVSNLHSKIISVVVIVVFGAALILLGDPSRSWKSEERSYMEKGYNQRVEDDKEMSTTSKSKAVAFDSAMMVYSYLHGKTFKSNDGWRMTFSSNNEMVINGKTTTATMAVVSFNSTQAILRGYCPLDGTYVRLLVDSSIGRIQNMDETSEVFNLIN